MPQLEINRASLQTRRHRPSLLGYALTAISA